MKRLLLGIASWIAALTISASALAADLQAGKHYTVINPPLPSSTPGKIEVLEFFSYGCIHCSNFHPVISSWAAKKPADVNFRRVHVTFNRPPLARLAKAFYAGEATGIAHKLDDEIFRAIHEQRVNFSSDEDLIKFVGSRGFDAKKFGDALNGFSMQSLVARGDQEAVAAKINGTPAIVVDGRYLVNNDATRNLAELMSLTEDVIALARKEKAKK
jgi:thiol:disulfide interchange protein DsbA